MKIIKRDYKRIIDELHKINGKIIIAECFVDNYDYKAFAVNCKSLFESQVTQENFIEVVAEIVSQIVDKKGNYKDLLDKLIASNNEYIRTASYDRLSFEELKSILDQNYMPSLHRRGVTPNMMLLYYFSKNIFNNEIVDKLKDYYKEYDQLIEKEHEKNVPDFFKDTGKMSIELIEISNFANEQYTNKDNIDWSEIEKQFDCVYDSENKVFNSVKRGIMLFLHTKLYIFSELSAKIDAYYTTLRRYSIKLNASVEKQELLIKQLGSLKEENANLQNKYKKARKQMLDLEKTVNQIKKEDTKVKDKQIIDLTKKNNFPKLRIEALEQQVEQLLESNEINKTITENIKIEEEPQTVSIAKELPEYQSIVVLGGIWNSKEKEALQKALPTCDIQFIDSEKTLAKIDRIANSDIVIFDTSRNAHGYYYKIKQYPVKLFHINKSKSDEVLKIWTL